MRLFSGLTAALFLLSGSGFTSNKQHVAGPLVYANTFLNNKQSAELFKNEKLRSVGRLYYDGMTRCTAILIKPDVIMLPAHCVIDDHKLIDSDFTFITGAVEETDGKRVQIDKCKTELFDLDPGNHPEKDVAFMTLRRRLDTLDFPPLEISEMSEIAKSTQTFMTGYLHRPGSANDNHAMTEPCNVVLNLPRAQIFLVNCSVTHRMSGSPFYELKDGKPVVIGMVVGNDSAHSTSDDENVEFSIKYANIVVDGRRLKDAAMRYPIGIGLLSPFKEAYGCAK